jgi:hypothetical protein
VLNVQGAAAPLPPGWVGYEDADGDTCVPFTTQFDRFAFARLLC